VGRKIRNLHVCASVCDATRRMREELRCASHVMYNHHQMHKEGKRQDDRESLLSKRGKRREGKGREVPGKTPRTCVHKKGVGIGFSFLLSCSSAWRITRFLLGRFGDVFCYHSLVFL
jgi:hypothetical protein